MHAIQRRRAGLRSADVAPALLGRRLFNLSEQRDLLLLRRPLRSRRAFRLAKQILRAISDGQQPSLIALYRDNVFERFEVGAEALGDLAGGVELEDVPSRRLRRRFVIFIGIVWLQLSGVSSPFVESPPPSVHSQITVSRASGSSEPESLS